MIKGLRARFDTRALRPPVAVPDASRWRLPPGVAPQVWAALLEWCTAGRGRRRQGSDAVQAASLEGGSETQRVELAETLCQHLDGSVRLAACGSAVHRIGLRLAVKLGDAFGGLGDAHPWDCGYSLPGPAGHEALKWFSPRRNTLIVMQSLTAADIAQRLEALRANAAEFRRQVRVLRLPSNDGDPQADAGPLRLEAGVPL